MMEKEALDMKRYENFHSSYHTTVLRHKSLFVLLLLPREWPALESEIRKKWGSWDEPLVRIHLITTRI